MDYTGEGKDLQKLLLDPPALVSNREIVDLL